MKVREYEKTMIVYNHIRNTIYFFVNFKFEIGILIKL